LIDHFLPRLTSVAMRAPLELPRTETSVFVVAIQ
jgi:hypothetical protein